MHSILKRYTIHLHPIQINQVLISQKCDEFNRRILFKPVYLIEYDTPGINVCNKIMNVYNNEEIIFLKNHGIIITTDDYDTLIPTLESLLTIFETKLEINLDKYKFVNQISKTV
jgi:rhamnose utilization protein RhaD (predicted bifunctional aldolase and dehydrogenase)